MDKQTESLFNEVMNSMYSPRPNRLVGAFLGAAFVAFLVYMQWWTAAAFFAMFFLL